MAPASSGARFAKSTCISGCCVHMVAATSPAIPAASAMRMPKRLPIGRLENFVSMGALYLDVKVAALQCHSDRRLDVLMRRRSHLHPLNVFVGRHQLIAYLHHQLKGDIGFL